MTDTTAYDDLIEDQRELLVAHVMETHQPQALAILYLSRCEQTEIDTLLTDMRRGLLPAERTELSARIIARRAEREIERAVVPETLTTQEGRQR